MLKVCKIMPIYYLRQFILFAAVMCSATALADPLDDAFSQYKSLNEQGKYSEALPFAQQAVELATEKFGEEHETPATALNNLGQLYDTLGDYAKAEPLLKRALGIWEKALGPDHQQVAFALNNLGGLYEDLGDYAKAEPLLKRSTQIYFTVFGEENAKTQASLEKYQLFMAIRGVRTWTDITGKFTREARFLELVDGVVGLRLEGGKDIKIPIEKLSEEDREHVTKVQEYLDSLDEPEEEDPFGG